MSNTGVEEMDAVLDPEMEIPEEQEPDLVDFLPRGYLSISQATRFLKCPWSWKLQYVDGLKPKTTIRMMNGVFIHAAVEKVLTQRMETGTVPSLETATDAFSDTFEQNKVLIDAWEGQEPGQAKDTGIKCTTTFHQKVAPTSTPVSVEKEFRIVVKSEDGKIRLPVMGRIDSVQAQVLTEDDYQRVREDLVRGKPVRVLQRLHDLKVSTDKWSQADLQNDLQFAVYSHAEATPDVRVDNISTGRGKVPTPKFAPVDAVISRKHAEHSLKVLQGVAQGIATGVFPMTDPSAWWCSEAWCSQWRNCRGK
jgi:hypothetical protein